MRKITGVKHFKVSLPKMEVVRGNVLKVSFACLILLHQQLVRVEEEGMGM